MDMEPRRVLAVDTLPFPIMPKNMLTVRDKSGVVINMINTKMSQVSRHSTKRDFKVDYEIDINIVPMEFMTTVLYVVVRAYNDTNDYICNYSHTKDKKHTYTIHIRLSDKHTQDVKNDDKIEQQIQYLKKHKIDNSVA